VPGLSCVLREKVQQYGEPVRPVQAQQRAQPAPRAQQLQREQQQREQVQRSRQAREQPVPGRQRA
jgi:hypothetical protein